MSKKMAKFAIMLFAALLACSCASHKHTQKHSLVDVDSTAYKNKADSTEVVSVAEVFRKDSTDVVIEEECIMYDTSVTDSNGTHPVLSIKTRRIAASKVQTQQEQQTKDSCSVIASFDSTAYNRHAELNAASSKAKLDLTYIYIIVAAAIIMCVVTIILKKRLLF